MRPTGLLFIFISSVLLFSGVQTSFAAPITGNPTGSVTLVEYYDYECPHCRRMEPVIERLQAEYPDLRVVHRVIPLLKPGSRDMARFALAATAQGQWRAVHRLLMRSPTAPTWADAERIAIQLGLNRQMLFKERQHPSVQQQIETNITLAEKQAIQGVLTLPTLVFKLSHGKRPVITLTGERSYALLSAVVEQLSGEVHVQMAQTKKQDYAAADVSS